MENTLISLSPEKPAGSHLRAAHVGLRTPDYAAALQWYTGKLGFRVLQEWTVDELQLAFLAPGTDDRFWLEVVHAPAAGPAPTPGQPLVAGFHHLCLEVDNLDTTLAELRARGVRVVREPFRVPAIGKRCGFIADLHGNVLELAETI